MFLWYDYFYCFWYADSTKGDFLLVRDMENYGQIRGIYRFVLTVLWVINMLILLPVPKFKLESFFKMEALIPRNTVGTFPVGNNLPSNQVFFFITLLCGNIFFMLVQVIVTQFVATWVFFFVFVFVLRYLNTGLFLFWESLIYKIKKERSI